MNGRRENRSRYLGRNKQEESEKETKPYSATGTQIQTHTHTHTHAYTPREVATSSPVGGSNLAGLLAHGARR